MQRAGITQRQMADLLGVSQPAVSVYLAGRLPPPRVLLGVARIGNTSIEWLLTGEEAAEEAAMQVREQPLPYGRTAVMMDLWEQLPSPLQQNVLQLMRTLIDISIDGSAKSG